MKAAVEKITTNRVRLEVEVEPERLGEAMHQAYRKVVGQVTVPGFRKGKVPRTVLENFLGKEVLYNEAVDMVVPWAYLEAIKETAIEPIDQPQVEVVQIEEGQPLVFKAEVEVKPEITLGSYQGLILERKPVQVGPEDVQRHLEQLQQRNARLEDLPPDEGAAESDRLTIDYNGSINGEPFEGGAAKDYTLELGSNAFIPGFEEQLVGVKAGEERQVEVVFPQDYQQQGLAGQEAVFQVAVKGIKRRILSPIDDEFARDVSEFETLEELRADVENKLKEQAERESSNELRSQAIKKASEAAQVDIPEVLVQRQIDAYLMDLDRSLRSAGLSLDQYQEFAGEELDQLRQNYREQAVQAVKRDLVLEAIAKAENLTVSEEEINGEIDRLAEQVGQDAGQIREMLAAQGELDSFRYGILMQKAIDFLVERAEVVDAKPPEGPRDEESSPATEAEEEKVATT